MKVQKLTAEPREITGRKVKVLRESGLVPGNVYGKDVVSYAVQVAQGDFKKTYQEVGETGVVELAVGGKTAPVLITNVQTHPVTDDIIHVDFRQIDLTKKVTATVPVKIIGEAPAEKSGIGTLVQQVNELEVEALPTDLPESFDIDVSSLEEVDAAVFVKDLKYDKDKVTVEADKEQIIVKIEPPQKEEEIVAPQPEEEVPAEAGSQEISEGDEQKEESVPQEDQKQE